MGKITVAIRHVDWRDGRPRFNPGPTVRALGFAAEDLKDDAGNWLPLEATLLWAAGRAAEIDAARQEQKAKAPPRRRKASSRQPALVYTTAEMVEDWKASPRFARNAPKTQKWYAERARRVAEHLPKIWAMDVDAVDAATANRAYEATLAALGASSAASIFTTLRSAFSWGRRDGRVKANPFKELGMETPRGRQRAATREEIAAMLAAAARLGRDDVADVMLFGLFTSQRQEDRLLLTRPQIAGGRVVVRQGKSRRRKDGGQLVDVVLVPPLLARLAAAETRRKALGIDSPRVFLDEAVRRPWTAERYRKAFAAVRQEAQGACPSLADLTDQDMRDTALSAAYSRGATQVQGAALAGHSQATAATVQDRHYVSRNSDMADAAALAILDWWER
ncbi:MAG TPA: hypothetical protein PLG99_05100 [Kaistiaceae bacterium]|nr:hypothetical protein [Kaistiaceae bacterium]